MRKLLRKILYFLRFNRLLGILKCKRKYSFNDSKKIISKIYKDKNIEVSTKKLKDNEVKYDLSIIIPVYNCESFIDICISSLINQNTKYNYEIIVVNDGSRDNSLMRLNKYNKKIKIINQGNSGAATARNKGVISSNGRYLGFVDIDDYISSDFVEKMLDYAYKTKSDVIKCNYFCFDEKKILYSTNYQSKTINKKIKNESIITDGFIWNGIYKREIFENISFPDGFMFEDMIFKMVILEKINSFSQIEDKLYYFRRNKKSTSRNKINYINYSVLDQLFLPFKLIELYNLEISNSLIKTLLNECTSLLFFRIRYLSINLKKAIFIYVSCMINEYLSNIDKCILNRYEEDAVKAFLNYDYSLWVATSICMYI